LFVSAALTSLLVLNSWGLMNKMEKATLGNSSMRADPVFDRAVVSRNLITSLKEHELPEGTKLLLVGPMADVRAGRTDEHPLLAAMGSYWDDNLKSAVAQGLGVRVFFSQVDTVAFADEPLPGQEDFYAVPYRWSGRLREVEQAQYWTDVGVRNLETNPAFAKNCFRKAIASDSLYAGSYFYLARVYFEANELELASGALRKYASLAPPGESRDRALDVLRSMRERRQ
jgi:hypothetical protein